jgi:DNA polymerase-3 subunit epsilon
MLIRTESRPMREIVLDTETTGLDPRRGDRVVEIGCVELDNHVATGRTFHAYLNPERGMPLEAFEVHGLSQQFLSDKPKFADIADQFLDFVRDAVLVIHNASFDLAFLNTELAACGRELLGDERVLDTLAIARARHPTASNSLDALCRRYNVDNSSRDKHGALLDSEILAEVYLELIGGRQPDLVLVAAEQTTQGIVVAQVVLPPRPAPLPSRLTDEERDAHARLLAELGDKAIWRSYAL